MAAQVGIGEGSAIRASNLEFGDTGFADSWGDLAIAIGYRMAETYPNGPSRNEYFEFVMQNQNGSTIVRD